MGGAGAGRHARPRLVRVVVSTHKLSLHRATPRYEDRSLTDVLDVRPDFARGPRTVPFRTLQERQAAAARFRSRQEHRGSRVRVVFGLGVVGLVTTALAFALG